MNFKNNDVVTICEETEISCRIHEIYNSDEGINHALNILNELVVMEFVSSNSNETAKYQEASKSSLISLAQKLRAMQYVKKEKFEKIRFTFFGMHELLQLLKKRDGFLNYTNLVESFIDTSSVFFENENYMTVLRETVAYHFTLFMACIYWTNIISMNSAVYFDGDLSNRRELSKNAIRLLEHDFNLYISDKESMYNTAGIIISNERTINYKIDEKINESFRTYLCMFNMTYVYLPTIYLQGLTDDRKI